MEHMGYQLWWGREHGFIPKISASRHPKVTLRPFFVFLLCLVLLKIRSLLHAAVYVFFLAFCEISGFLSLLDGGGWRGGLGLMR